MTVFIKEQITKLEKQVKLNNDIDTELRAAIKEEKEIKEQIKKGLQQYKEAHGFKSARNKKDLELLGMTPLEYFQLRQKLENEYNATIKKTTIKRKSELATSKKFLSLALKINFELIYDRLYNILGAALKEYYSNDKNKDVPYHYKKVLSGLDKIIDNCNIKVGYGLTAGDFDEFTIYYKGIKNNFVIYSTTRLDDSYSPVDVELCTKRQLLNRAKKAYILRDKIKVLNTRIDELKSQIGELTKYTFDY